MTKKPSSPPSPDLPAATAPRKCRRRPNSEGRTYLERNCLFPEGAFGHTMLGIMRRAARPMNATEIVTALCEFHGKVLTAKKFSDARKRVGEGLIRMAITNPPVLRRTADSPEDQPFFEIPPLLPPVRLVNPFELRERLAKEVRASS